MVWMAAYEGLEAGQSDLMVTPASNVFDGNKEDCQSTSGKSFYVVPNSFVIHTYSRVQLNPELSTLDSFYRHKVTMFKKKSTKPLTESEQIHDEIERQVAECECPNKFEVTRVGEGKYRFGDSQKLRLLRILRSVVMVRVGGGWETLTEFLNKNDPCRAEGRASFDIRHLGVSPEMSTHSMQLLRTKRPGLSREGSGADLKDGTSSTSLGPRKKSGTNLKAEKSGELKKASSREGLASPRSTTPTTSRIKRSTSHSSVHSDDGKLEASGHTTQTSSRTTVTKRTTTSTSRPPTGKSSTSRTSPGTTKSSVTSRTTTRIPTPSATTGGPSRTTTTTTRSTSSGSRSHTTTTTKTTSSSSTSKGSTKSTKTTKK